MSEQKKATVEMIYGEDLSATVKEDTEKLKNAVSKNNINLDKAHIEGMVSAGEAFQADDDAKYVIQGFDDSTLVTELGIRLSGMRLQLSAIQQIIEGGFR